MGGTPVDQRVIPWKSLDQHAKQPTYGTPEAAGADLYANVLLNTNGQRDTLVIEPNHRKLFRTGVAVELPPGTYAKIEGRSGLAFKNGLIVLGGVIDSDYRGDVGVILYNSSHEPVTIKHGDRIAQLIIQSYIAGVFEEAEKLEGTTRQAAGFGSSGK